MARVNEVFPQAVLLTMRVSIQALVTAAHTPPHTHMYKHTAIYAASTGHIANLGTCLQGKGISKYVPNYSMSGFVLTAAASLFYSKFERVNCTLVIKARKSSAL